MLVKDDWLHRAEQNVSCDTFFKKGEFLKLLVLAVCSFFSSELALIRLYKSSNKAEYHFHVNTVCTYILNLKS